jgi:type IV secretory pathway TrbD component
MSGGGSVAQNRVFKSLHKPLTYLGVERTLFYFICVSAVGAFNLFNSILAGVAVFIGGIAFGHWVTNSDPAFLRILAKSERYKLRYDAAKQEIPRVEVMRLGYKRYWVAEHHSIQGLVCSATPVLIGHIAAATKTIRVGSGGIMLPNHAPLVVAEQFGTLEAMYPGRIDLGLGRAPGGDFQTMRA